MKKKFLSVLLASAMVVSMAACGKSNTPASSTPAGSESVAESSSEEAQASSSEAAETEGEAEEEIDWDAYGEASSKAYEDNLGEFLAAYEVAKGTENLSERFALMAISEAKLLESGVMLPLESQGGNYAISRLVPGTIDYVLWGSDNDRFHSALVTTEIIKAADIAEMRAKWYALKGTDTYEDWARDYLAGKGYEIKDTYTIGYSSDPQTWDALATSRAADSEAIINTWDGLLEYDNEGVQRPALAENYDVSGDGLTYTFHLRKGVEWVDSQGRKVADLVADDFVAAMNHMMDAQGGLEWLIDGVIKNAHEYMAGDITDFSQVGVSAPDDYTVVYTLEAPCSYFVTMMGYNVFAPMSRSYYESQGGKFGVADFDSSAADYLYGTTPDNIAYCGPYVVTNATAQNTIVFKANESYWNKDNINIKTITWMFNDGTDATKAYNDAKNGVIDGAGLNAAAVEAAKADGIFEENAYVSSTDATTFSAFFNLNRTAFSNFNDHTIAVSPQTEEDAARTNAAMNNVHFRRALAFSIDRGAYRAQTVGDTLKYASMRNSFTPGDFVTLPEDVTVDINGTATTFAAGTYYGEILQAQLDADGVKIKAWDPEQNEGAGSSDYYDGWYNVDNAVEEMAAAVAELADAGVTVDASNPIYVDLPYFSGSEAYSNRAQALKKSVEEALGGQIIVNLVECVDSLAWYYAGYYCDYGYQGNYDIYDVSGWGPDYGDPSSYLDTMLPDYAGYMVKMMGIF